MLCLEIRVFGIKPMSMAIANSNANFDFIELHG